MGGGEGGGTGGGDGGGDATTSASDTLMLSSAKEVRYARGPRCLLSFSSLRPLPPAAGCTWKSKRWIDRKIVSEIALVLCSCYRPLAPCLLHRQVLTYAQRPESTCADRQV